MTEILGPNFLTYLLENEPWTYFEAISCPEAFYWKDVINSKIESVMNNHIWKLVDLLLEKPIGHKWIFKEIKNDGTIDKYKARFVVKGFRKQEDAKYFDTYSFMSRIASI